MCVCAALCVLRVCVLTCRPPPPCRLQRQRQKLLGGFADRAAQMLGTTPIRHPTKDGKSSDSPAQQVLGATEGGSASREQWVGSAMTCLC